jgi:GT2 family glycosyltransferase
LEEWDLGLQMKMAGLKSYVVPVTGYSHEWGISRDPRKVVRYYGTEQAEAREILARNRIHFWRKWLAITGRQDPGATGEGV